ncbi:uncharacterized protein UTRI_01878_B [Ustilago trichophora]|uniref:Uncharacterized protein n=1 Tax=Ustilago trichophora TaxID=86804 RepID=A0A5C3DUJ3_9BASI|nr:uncharacterized protein UTRI_01878_B [Ustilago trichophora]
MHPSRHSDSPQHQRASSSSARSNHNDVHSTPYVSTLSHALNISTPTSSQKSAQAAQTSTAQSTPTRLTHSVAGSLQATPTRLETKRTPKRIGDPPRILTLSGHEAFQSPSTPVSPWISALASGFLSLDAGATQRHHASIDGEPLNLAHDQEWLMSGPSSSSTANIFEAQSHETPVAAHLSHIHNASAANGPCSLSIDVNSNRVIGALPAAKPPGPFRAYREQPTSDPRVAIYETTATSDMPTSRSALSPTLVASLSPLQPSSAFPLTLPDGTFLSAIFEQDTPSLSTHHLPGNDLTEQLSMQAKHPMGGRPASTLSHPFTFSMQTGRSDSEGHRRPHSTNFGHVLGSQQVSMLGSIIPSTVDHPTAQATDSVHNTSAVFLRPMARAAANHGHVVVNGKYLAEEPANGTHRDITNADSVQSNASSQERSDGITANDKSIAGLGLNLNAAPTEVVEQVEILAGAQEGSHMSSSLLVDEMGRWMLGSDGLQLTDSDHSSLSANDSRRRRGRWHVQETSTASLGATTEGSFTSHSNSSTWDSSFNDMPSPFSGPSSTSADNGTFVTTPASSIGLSHAQNSHPSKSDGLRPPVVTPEVAMGDFSEFGQSISIEQMAEERWRTWPRNRDSVILRDRASASALPISPTGPAPQLQAEERTSFDSLSVSASSTRSRLLAEPYNKNMRSGRPSSSASTSSRSSIGNAAALEGQQSSGVTGPTRPRSYIATGSLRMSSATRTGSSGGGSSSEGGQTSNERLSGTALALRRARGLSQGGHPPSSSSAAMKLTRSSDALMTPGFSNAAAAKFRHSVALQRTALSSEGLSQVSRPQSLLETTSHPESVQKAGSTSAAKPKAKVGFNEVSVALDTLRMFLKQKEPGGTTSGNDAAASLPPPTESSDASSPGKPSRTLRRAKGVLPPRGAFSSVDEFGMLQTSASSSNVPALHSASAPSANHGRSQSLGGLLLSPTTNSRRQDDRLAVLADLSERVMKLKAETERQKERHAAASMPPPSSLPASLHQRTQSPRTRREIHEEYLRKRATGS